MSDPVIVQINDLWDVSVEEAERLVATIKDAGVEAWRYKVERQEGFGPPSGQELVFLWLASTAGTAVINEVIRITIAWMRERFHREQNSNPKRILIVLYEGDEGRRKQQRSARVAQVVKPDRWG